MLRASLISLNLSSLSALVVVVSEGDAFTCGAVRAGTSRLLLSNFLDVELLHTRFEAA
jgi:hypothetical protein